MSGRRLPFGVELASGTLFVLGFVCLFACLLDANVEAKLTL